MSEKNFMAYGDAESVFTGYANRIKQSPTTFVGTMAQWDALSLSQKAEYTLVDITDDEFSPNNFVDWGSYSILGAKNLLPVTMASQVLSGVTFTVDSASGIIGVSGNNSGTPFSDVIGTTLLKPGTYKVTTGQATELNAQIGIAVTNASSGTILARSWNGTEVFTISSDTQVKFHIEVNVTGMITSTTIYPTCKLDSIKDESYVPYAMTNRDLTSQISNLANKAFQPVTTVSFPYTAPSDGFCTMRFSIASQGAYALYVLVNGVMFHPFSGWGGGANWSCSHTFAFRKGDVLSLGEVVNIGNSLADVILFTN